MDRPTITIDGKTIDMPTPKARFWREIIKFEEGRKELTVEKFCDEHVNIIARAFGVTGEEVLDSLDVDEILPTYMNVLMYIMQLLTARLKVTKKNEDIEAQV